MAKGNFPIWKKHSDISSIISFVTNHSVNSDEIHLHTGAYFVRFNTSEKFLASTYENAR